VSSGSFQASDECDAADCNPLRDRTFEVLPDVVPNEWPGRRRNPRKESIAFRGGIIRNSTARSSEKKPPTPRTMIGRRIPANPKTRFTALAYPWRVERASFGRRDCRLLRHYFFADEKRRPISSQFSVFHQAAA
jgi:hypothetical protein